MTRTNVVLTICLLLMNCLLTLVAQTAASATVPAAMKYSGTLTDINNKPLTGTVGVTFLLYKDQTGGAPLWMETQNVQADKSGHYSVLLGATSHGLPSEAFSGGEARWLAVQVSGAPEQSRVALVSVPYALKAQDAETIGGRPASAFMLAPAPGAKLQAAAAPEQANEIVCLSGTACKTGFVPVFSSNGGSAAVTASLITQSGSTVAVAGNQKVAGSVAAAGSVSASGNVSANGNVSASSMTAISPATGITSTITGPGNAIAAVSGNATATGPAGFTFGVVGQSASDTGRGVFGLATGNTGVGVIGETTAAGIGVVGKALPGSTGIGVWGESPAGWSFYSAGDASQSRTGGGWAKALLLVNTQQAPYTIQRCYNSTLQGPAATTPPCGFNLTEVAVGDFWIDIGFEIDDRFIMATPWTAFLTPGIAMADTHTLNILWYNAFSQQLTGNAYYWIAIF